MCVYIYIYTYTCKTHIYIYIYTCIHNIHIYIYICIYRDASGDPCGRSPSEDSGLRGVRLRQNLNLKGWNSHVHRKFPGSFGSTNLSRDNLSSEIGRIPGFGKQRFWEHGVFEGERNARTAKYGTLRIGHKEKNTGQIDALAKTLCTRTPGLLYPGLGASGFD